MDRDVSAPVCYRHTDRQTFLSCSNCGKPICFECSHDAAVGQRCPECAGPGQRTRVVTSREVFSPALQRSPVSFGIIIAAVTLFAVGLVSQEADSWLVRNFALATFLDHEWWRAFTSTLLHGSIMHVGFNMYALYLFGPRLEREAGMVPFVLLYLATAAAGSAAFLAIRGDEIAIAVGASGAIFGLFGVWLIATYNIRHTPIGRSLFQQLVFLLAINAALPLFLPNIAWEAHAGGFAAGVAIGFLWGRYAAGRADAVRIRTSVAGVALVLATAALFVV